MEKNIEAIIAEFCGKYIYIRRGKCGVYDAIIETYHDLDGSVLSTNKHIYTDDGKSHMKRILNYTPNILYIFYSDEN